MHKKPLSMPEQRITPHTITPVLRELTAQEMYGLLPLLKLHNSWINARTFNRFLKEMLPQGYRAVGAFLDEELVGCSGFWIRTRFWCGRQLDVDNFVVHPEYRRHRIGSQLLRWLEDMAARESCDLIVLDTYVSAAQAQHFYMRHGFAMTGFHMTKIPHSNALGALPYSAKRKA